MKTHYKGERKFPFPVTLAFLPTYPNMDNADSPSFTEFRERDKAVGLSGGTVSLLSKLNLILIFKEWSYWAGGYGIFIVHVNFLPLNLHGRQSSRLFIRSTRTDKIAPPSIPTGCPPPALGLLPHMYDLCRERRQLTPWALAWFCKLNIAFGMRNYGSQSLDAQKPLKYNFVSWDWGFPVFHDGGDG